MKIFKSAIWMVSILIILACNIETRAAKPVLPASPIPLTTAPANMPAPTNASANPPAPTNVPAPTSAPALVERSGSPAIQTVGLTPVDNGQIVYDANQKVYWLANADLAADPAIRATLGVTGINPNGTMNYTTALQWVNALNHANNGSGYLGHTNWQLPGTPPIDSTCSVLHGGDGKSFGAKCTGSGLGNLYNIGLALTYPNSVVPGFTDTIGPFKNLNPRCTGPPSRMAAEKRPTHSLRILQDLIRPHTTTFMCCR